MIDQLTDGIIMICGVACVVAFIGAGVQWLSETKLIGGIYGKVAKARKDAEEQEAERRREQA